jgi:ADP-ribose pyrophosphatase
VAEETRLSRQTPYAGRIFQVHVDSVAAGDAGRHSREIVEHPGSVVLLPRLGDSVLLVKQFRYAVGLTLLELPAGTLETGEAVEAAAHRELREEVGFDARRLTPLGDFLPSPGYATERMLFFLADELFPAPADGDPDEDIEIVPLPIDEAIRAARDGELRDLKTTAGLLLLAARL